MDRIKPPALKKGSNIRIVAPASSPNLQTLKKSIQVLEKYGLSVSIGSNVRRLIGTSKLSSSPEDRARELMDAFSDHSVSAIFCARGGNRSIQLLPYLDYDVISENPKIFIGYSDITALHLAFNKMTGLITFHGPMPASDSEEYLKESFSTYIDFLSVNSSYLSYNLDFPPKYVVPGKTDGLSMGTNFSLLMSVLPTKYFPDTADKIWFLEDVNIPPNVIDRYIDTIIISDKIRNVKGFAIGSFSRVPSVEGSPSVEDIVVERFLPLNKPTLYSLPFGHGERQIILPLNAKMKISSEEPYLEILENVVD